MELYFEIILHAEISSLPQNVISYITGRQAAGLSSRLPPPGLQRLNSGCQACWQVLLPAEPSLSPLEFYLKACSVSLQKAFNLQGMLKLLIFVTKLSIKL